MIPYGKQQITDDDVDAVVEVLRSSLITQGPVLPRFENELASQVKASHVVAGNSATSMLHLACLSVGLKQGGMMWTSPNTFVASANAALFCGADVDFVDIDPFTLNMDVGALESKLQVTRRRGGALPDVVMPVHFGGLPCDMSRIAELAAEYGFRIVEDASHAIGGSYRGMPVGSCEYSDITVFSFHPVKIITTAEGGAAATNSAELASRMRLLREHGITRDPDAFPSSPDGPWAYEQIDLGFNYRMTELQAALGRSQLKRLEEYVKRRNELADYYDQSLSALPVNLQARADSPDLSARHLYVICLDNQNVKRRREIFEGMCTEGIGVNVHYRPVHTQTWYRNRGFKPGDFPHAERYYAGALTLPLYPGLENEEAKYVVSTLGKLLQ